MPKAASRIAPRGFVYSALCGIIAAFPITHRICRPLQTRCVTVVGYTDKALELKTKQIIGVPFQNVTGGEIDIQSIVPQNDGVVAGENESQLWWYDTTIEEYKYGYWTEEIWEDDGTEEGIPLGVPGWCEDQETLFQVKKTFAAGQSFWVKPSAGHTVPTVMISGQVVSSTADAVALPLEQKTKQLVCNVFPVDISIQKAVPMNDGVIAGENESQIWWYDTKDEEYKYGYWTEEIWEDDGTEEGIPLGVPGWCEDQETLFQVIKTLKSNEGFWIKPSAGHTVPQITFPNALK